jgi:nicotinamidase/pyrazinamidase
MSAKVNPGNSVLLLVDLQPDFLPGGNLAVGDGDAVLPGIRRLMESGVFPLQVATQDWHPPGHASFASSHPGRQPFDVIELHDHDQVLWPDHCVQGTAGAERHPDLPGERLAAVIRKGSDPRVDSYSGFQNNWGPDGTRPATGLTGYLMDRGVKTVYLCGLARDYCVRWTAEDSVEAGFETFFIWDLTRSVDPAGDEDLKADLTSQGVRFLDHSDLGS